MFNNRRRLDKYAQRFALMEAYLAHNKTFTTSVLVQVYGCHPAGARRWISVYRKRHPGNIRFSRSYGENVYVMNSNFRRRYLHPKADGTKFLKTFSLLLGINLFKLEGV